MAAITHSLLSGVSLPVLRIYASLARVGQALKQHRQRSQQLHDLAAFTDRELWDVGLSRSDFLAIRQGSFRRD